MNVTRCQHSTFTTPFVSCYRLSWDRGFRVPRNPSSGSWMCMASLSFSFSFARNGFSVAGIQAAFQIRTLRLLSKRPEACH